MASLFSLWLRFWLHFCFILSNLTLNVPDDFEGPLDLDAETTRLSHLWDVSRMSMRELVTACNLSQLAFARGACIPPRTVQGWVLEERKCPVYLRFLLAEHYGLI